jgi:hypothetical protein
LNNLTRFDSEGIEIFINELGESFSSIRGVARMAGRNESTIREFLTARKISVIKAEIDTATGKKTARLLSESSICKVLAEYNSERLEQFAMLGIRTAMHQIAGYQQKPVVQIEPIDIYNLDQETMDRLEAWWCYRKYPSLEAVWEDYNHPDGRLEGFVPPDEADMLDDRLKVMPDEVIKYLCGLWILGNMHYSPEGMEKTRNALCNDRAALAAQEFQAQIDRTQLGFSDFKSLNLS